MFLINLNHLFFWFSCRIDLYIFVAIMRIERKRTKFIQMICAELGTQFSRLSRSIFAECSIQNMENTSVILKNDRCLDGESFGVPKEDRLDNSADEFGFNSNHNDDLQTDTGFDMVVKKRCCCLVDTGLTFIEPFAERLRIDINTQFPDANWNVTSSVVSL